MNSKLFLQIAALATSLSVVVIASVVYKTTPGQAVASFVALMVVLLRSGS